MAEPTPRPAPEVALRRLTALARRAGAVGRADPALARGRARLIDEIERPRLPLEPRRPWLIPAALAPLLIAGAMMVLRPAPRLDYRIDSATAAESYVHAGASGATARFSDGTTVRFGPDARGRVAAVTARGARIHLERGAARFKVTPRPGAEWFAEAGPFTVTVTGTEFDLRWERERLELTMQRGAVVVRGPLAADGIALHGGQRLVADVVRGELTIAEIRAAPVAPPTGGASPAPASAAEERSRRAAPAAGGGAADGAAAAAPAPEKAAARAPAGAAPRSPVAQDATGGDAPAPRSYRERVARGDFAGVIADAEERGIDATIDGSPLAELAALADAARYAGRNDLARRALLAERSRFPGSPEARSAAFLLGRLSEASSPAEALSWYDRYLAESPEGSLASEALGRKMLVVRASGGDGAARPIAQEYLRRYPQGTFAVRAAEVLDGR
ncbi:FecR family protein [Sorangium sp. So ce1036]|uniref:FecR domain-containing protein n=1 Tax=Sorangium sp. So ce1036 TaxID=3133328 RepID=UPI003F0BD305